MATGPAGPPVVQRQTGFEVEHKTRRYEQQSDVLAFDRLQTALGRTSPSLSLYFSIAMASGRTALPQSQ